MLPGIEQAIEEYAAALRPEITTLWDHELTASANSCSGSSSSSSSGQQESLHEEGLQPGLQMGSGNIKYAPPVYEAVIHKVLVDEIAGWKNCPEHIGLRHTQDLDSGDVLCMLASERFGRGKVPAAGEGDAGMVQISA